MLQIPKIKLVTIMQNFRKQLLSNLSLIYVNKNGCWFVFLFNYLFGLIIFQNYWTDWSVVDVKLLKFIESKKCGFN